jgi:hypothetical protein
VRAAAAQRQGRLQVWQDTLSLHAVPLQHGQLTAVPPATLSWWVVVSTCIKHKACASPLLSCKSLYWLWCRDLMVRVASMYSPVKVLPYVQEGLNSKNNRWVDDR